jgi:hypothetical protein
MALEMRAAGEKCQRHCRTMPWPISAATNAPSAPTAARTCILSAPIAAASSCAGRPNARRNREETVPMPRQLISSGSSFEKTNGYSRAVVDGEWDIRLRHDRLRQCQDVDLRRPRRAGALDLPQHRGSAERGRCLAEARRAGDLHRAARRGLAGHRADPRPVFRRDPAGFDGDHRGAHRSAHAHRNRGDTLTHFANSTRCSSSPSTPTRTRSVLSS